MSIQSLIEGRYRLGRMDTRKEGPWRIETDDWDDFCGKEYELWHYGTRMCRWRESVRDGVEILIANTGYGSVSDQNGMNILFRVLGVDAYYSRKGGAEIRFGD